MRIEVRGIEIPLAAQSRAAIEERTRLLLGRVALRVADVRVIVRDVNGPRKGIDRVCSVDVRLIRGGEVHAEASDGVIRSAVEAALDRASRATLRLLRRQRELGRQTLRRLSGETGVCARRRCNSEVTSLRRTIELPMTTVSSAITTIERGASAFSVEWRVSGSETDEPVTIAGVRTMKMMRRTRQTSTRGVTLISDCMSGLLERQTPHRTRKKPDGPGRLGEDSRSNRGRGGLTVVSTFPCRPSVQPSVAQAALSASVP